MSAKLHQPRMVPVVGIEPTKRQILSLAGLHCRHTGEKSVKFIVRKT